MKLNSVTTPVINELKSTQLAKKAQEIIDNFEDFPINFNTILEQKLNIQKYKDKYLNPQQPNFKTSPII